MTAQPGPQTATHPEATPLNPDTHITILAVLNFLAALLLILGGVVALWGTMFAGAWMDYYTPEPVMPVALGGVGIFVFLIALGLALPAVLAGVGLTGRQEWGRVLALVTGAVAGVVALASFTFFPLLYTVYAFWALTREEVVSEFRRDSGEPQLG